MCTRQKGFSLVELAVVLLIIGLLVGGTLGVQSMIRNAELNSVASEAEKIQISTQNFYEKYNSLPGDMPNATAIWGARHATFATCIGAAPPSGNHLATCNGNGNGRILYQDTDSVGVAFTTREDIRQWNHLSNARMYEGSYSGREVGGGVIYTGGVNIPASRVDGGAFQQWYVGNRDAVDPYWFAGDYTHVVRFGANGDASLPAIRPALSTREMWALDSKADDGLPNTGKIIHFKDGAPISGECVIDTGTSKIYDLDAPGLKCVYIQKLVY